MSEIGKIIRFLLTGGTATALDGALYWVLNPVLGITPAKGISATVACVYGYLMNKAWTFRDREKTNVRLVARYAGAQVLNIGTNVAVNAALVYAWNHRGVAFVGATAAGMTVNFLLQRFFVFSQKECS